MRYLFQTIGDYGLFPSSKDLEEAQKHCRRIVAKTSITKGEKLSENNVDCRRPRKDGIDPMFLEVVLGRKAQEDIKENEAITWDKI